MIDKDHFKQRIFQKYEENKNWVNDDFYNTHFYSEKKLKSKCLKKITISNIIPIIATFSTVYAGIVAIDYFQQKTKTNFEDNIGYDYSQDMNYQDKIYHKMGKVRQSNF